MFDLKIELDSEDLKLGVNGFSRANMTIKGQYKEYSSDGKSMLIFISATNLLLNIIDLVNKDIDKYKFDAIEGGFVFYIKKKGEQFELESYRGGLITKSTAPELIKSIWSGVSQFYDTYRPLIKEADSPTLDLDDTIQSFKSLYSGILGLSPDTAESSTELSNPLSTKDLIDNHVAKSEQWIREKMLRDKTRQCSSFFDPYVTNEIIFTAAYLYETDIKLWLESDSRTPLTRAMYLQKFCGFVLKDNYAVNTKRALVIWVKDNSKRGYRVLTTYPTLRPEYGLSDDGVSENRVTDRTLRNKLHKLFSCYFHQDWVDYHNLNEGDEINFNQPVELFKQKASIEDLGLAVQQLEQLVGTGWKDEWFDETLVYEFDCFVNPEAFGLTNLQFLKTVLNQLKQGGRYLNYDPPKSSIYY